MYLKYKERQKLEGKEWGKYRYNININQKKTAIAIQSRLGQEAWLIYRKRSVYKKDITILNLYRKS